jgi:hypothetical protein
MKPIDKEDGMEPSPIIIYGSPRSGTSYLNRILNQHPDVLISEEYRLFGWVHESLRVATQDDRYLRNGRQEFVDYLTKRYPDLIRDFYRRLRPDVRYWGDKNPHYASAWSEGSLQTIADLFPEARFIHIIRDGRDVVTSLVRKGWAALNPAHQIWMTHLHNGSEFGRAQPPDRYFELHYEDLIKDDLGVVGKVFDFLGIDPSPEVVRFCEAQTRKRTPFQKPTRDLARGAEVSDWGRLLAPDQRLASLDRIGEMLIRFGYETDASLEEAKRETRKQVGDAPIHPLRHVISESLPRQATLLVVSGGSEELLMLDSRRMWHFPQVEDGQNTPLDRDLADDQEAVAHLEYMQGRGAEFMVVPTQAFSWLLRYDGLRQRLETRGHRLLSDFRCVIYRLGQ